jgi:peptidoglycan/xylan/chitin deacetylase (PgdA/CDA1 family)
MALRVLTYHRILDLDSAADVDPSIISATPKAFEWQMRYLRKHYAPVSVLEVLEAVESGRSLPRKAVLVTFDDGYREFGEVAWPILRRYGIPAVLFVPTAFPGCPQQEFWWDRVFRSVMFSERTSIDIPPLGSFTLDDPEKRITAIRALQAYIKSRPHQEAMAFADDVCRRAGEPAPIAGQVLSWNELRTLVDDGLTVGLHTRTHAALDQLTTNEVRSEISGARADLISHLGGVPPVIAYPYGSHNPAVVATAAEEGMKLGFTCREGHNRLPLREPLRMRRTNVSRRTSPEIFALRLSSIFATVDRVRQARRERRNMYSGPKA